MLFTFLLLLSGFAEERVLVRTLAAQKALVVDSQQLSINTTTHLQRPFRVYFDDRWRILASNKQYSLKLQEPLVLRFAKARVQGREYEGELRLVYNKKRQGIDVIYPVPMAKYLKGVLPAEMPAAWPLEALKAQVVASKSYVISQRKEKKDLPFDVDADVMDQVFNKSRYFKLPKSLRDKVDQAIEATKEIYLQSGTDVLKAYFHSHCGGHTENPVKVWHAKEKWQGSADPYCMQVHVPRWQYNVNLEDFSQKLAEQFGEKKGEVLRIMDGERNDSGRLEKVFVFLKDGRIRAWPTQDIRQSLGFSKVKSTKMQISLENGKIHFQGKGYGHGVGMCQHGAKKMAAMGKSYREILNFYYPKASLKKIEAEAKYLAEKTKETAPL